MARGSGVKALDNQGNPLPSPNAHGRRAILAAGACQFIEQFGGYDRATG